MKIGLICPYDIFKGGGVQECVHAMQSELVRRGHQVMIITPRPAKYKGLPPKDTLFMGVSRDVKSPLHTVVQFSAGNSERMIDILDEEQFDVLHFHEPWVPMIGRQILAKSDAINIGTFHARLPDTRVSKTLERVITPYTKGILKSFDALTAVSDAGAEYVRKLTDSPITLVPNGIDLHKYVPKPDSKVTEPTIFYIGRLEKRKGVKYLIQAFAVLQETLPNAKLLIGGNGPDKQKLEELVSDLELTNIEFLGYVEESEKLRLMQSSTVFCAPALYGESFGIVLLEAMAAGTPIVAGDNPGYAGVLQGRGEISLVTPKHADDFARRLHVLLTDKGLRDTWNEWALDYVKQFSYARIVDRYEALYTKLHNDRKQ